MGDALCKAGFGVAAVYRNDVQAAQASAAQTGMAVFQWDVADLRHACMASRSWESGTPAAPIDTLGSHMQSKCGDNHGQRCCNQTECDGRPGERHCRAA